MKRAVSIAAVSLVAAFVAGVVFLLPPTVSREAIERSVIHEQSLLDKAWRLPTASAFGHHVDYQSQQIPRVRFLLTQQSVGPASVF